MGEGTAVPWRQLRAAALDLGVAALAAACLLGGVGCGGRAEDGEPDGADEAGAPAPANVPARGNPRQLGGGTGSTTPSQAPTIAPEAVQTFCYVPSSLERTPALEEVLPFLPADAFDGVGCLAGEYSSWLVPSRCVYDPSGADFANGRCCYRLDSVAPDCP